MRDVEADERSRHLLETELSLELVDRIARALLGFVSGESQLFQQVARILNREIDQLTPRTALRNVNLGALERRLDQLAVFRLERNQQLTRAILERQVASRQIRLKDRGISLFLEILEKLMLAGEELAATNSHERHDRVVAVAR